jgi:two-component system LytT family response regulator
MGANKINVVLIDDINTLDLLTIYLNKRKEIKIVAKADSLEEGLRQIILQKPSLIFLDIEMPPGTGLDLAEKIIRHKINSEIIFITSHRTFATEAIKFHPIAYILKPFSLLEIEEALKAYREKQKKKMLENRIQLNPKINKILIYKNTSTLFINVLDIIYCCAEGNYTRFFLKNKTSEVVCFNLGLIEAKLPHLLFYRITRSQIINLSYLENVNRKEGICHLFCNGEQFDLKVPAKSLTNLKTELKFK